MLYSHTKQVDSSAPQVIADEMPDGNKLPLELSGLQRPQLLETMHSCLPE